MAPHRRLSRARSLPLVAHPRRGWNCPGFAERVERSTATLAPRSNGVFDAREARVSMNEPLREVAFAVTVDHPITMAQTPRLSARRGILSGPSVRVQRIVPACVAVLIGCGGVVTPGAGNEQRLVADASGAGQPHSGGASSASDGGEHLTGGSPGFVGPTGGGGGRAGFDASPAPADAASCEGHKTGDRFTVADCACLLPGCAVCQAPAFCGPPPGFPSPFEQCTALAALYYSCTWTDRCPSCYCGL